MHVGSEIGTQTKQCLGTAVEDDVLLSRTTPGQPDFRGTKVDEAAVITGQLDQTMHLDSTDCPSSIAIPHEEYITPAQSHLCHGN